MIKTLLLRTPEQIREHYEEVVQVLDSNPLYKCIVEHAYDMIAEDELAAKVMSCKYNGGKSQITRKDFDDALAFLVNEVLVRRGMLPENTKWRYVAPDFIRASIDHLKKTDPSRRQHI